MSVLPRERYRPPPVEAGSCVRRGLLLWLDHQHVKRTAGRAEVASRYMQIDRRFLKVAMAEQHLDCSQVGSGFEQMRGKAVTQSMRVNLFVLKPGTFGSTLAGSPKNLGGDGRTAGMPAIARKEPFRRFAPQSPPILAECLEQLRAEHDITVLASLASPDMNDHALAVDVTNLQERNFGAARASGIECHQ